jgi:hypothetical protein
LKKGIEYHERAAIAGKFIQQPSVQRAIPGLSARLVKLIERFVVHQDKRDVVRDGARAEAEKIVIAGVHPSFTERRFPQDQTAKHRQHRTRCGFKKIMLPDGFHDSPDSERRSVGKVGKESSVFSIFSLYKQF